jgi:cytochrome P450
MNTRLREIKNLPGPSGLPWLGNLLQIDAGRLHLILEQWQRRYGDYFRFRIGPREFLAVADPEAIRAIFRDRPDGFQRTSRVSAIADEMGFGGLFSSNGEAWRRQRTMVMASFDPRHVQSYFPTFVKVTQRFAKRWQHAIDAGEPIDLQADLMRYTVDVTAGLAFGADINTLESDQEVIQHHLNKIFPALFRLLLSPVELRKYITLPRDRELDRHLAALHTAVEGFIAQARKRINADPGLRERPTNLIEAMVAARDTAGSGLDDCDVSGNVLTMLLAGEDTTANTLAWMIYLLDRNRDDARRASREVRLVLGQAPTPTSHEQLSSFAFVEACAHETMRLKPVAPIQLQQAVHDTVVADIAVPAGTVLMCLTRTAAVAEEHFPQASTFRPSRWLEDGQANQAASSAKRVAMPFGGGPRICPGRYLALLEMKMLMGMLYGSFDVDGVTTPDGREAEEHLAFTMGPLGLRLKLRRRDGVPA